MAIGLITDIAVGMDPGGSHAWSRPRDLLENVNVGAPPDLFQANGQDWGLTAFSPTAMRASGYAGFLATLRSAMRHAGGVRIDHILGLQRLWLTPRGASPTEGVYLSYPLDDLLGLIALESRRSGAIVIGEDLGTVPPGFRDRLEARGVMGMDVLMFERDKDGAFKPPQAWSARRCAMTSTHDLPPIAGWWREADLDLQAALGADEAGLERRRDERAQDRERLWAAACAAGCAQGPMPAREFPEAAVDAAGLGVWEWDVRKGALTWNDRNRELLGITHDRPVVIDDYLGQVHPDDLEADLDQVAQLVEGRISSYQIEKRYIHRQGQVIWVLRAVSLVRDADGKPLYFIAQIKDAGERQRLRSALALQSAIVDSAQAAIISADADGLIVSFNKAAQRLLGYREDEVVGRLRAEALHDPQELAAHAAWLSERFGRRVDTGFEALTAYLRVHDADHREWQYVRKDGVRVQVLLSSTALRDDNGRITGFVGIASDISQQKRNESELKAALEEKETLLREVYHRVKNNLQVVGSLFNLQLRSLPPGPVQAVLADAADRVHTMALLHEKLYCSPTLSAIDLDDYFGDLLHRIAVSTAAAERGIDVQSHCVRLQIGLDTAVPLGLIVNELVGNALKHAFPDARTGRVRLRVEIEGDGIVLSVDDDGVGLPADGRHLSSASLGLVLVRSLSSQLDADFALESGAGTLARLRLSRSRASIAPETDFEASRRSGGSASGAEER